MHLGGKITGFDLMNMSVTFGISPEYRRTFTENLTKYIDRNLDIDFKIHKEKRSLSANSYFHVLCHKIAEVIGSSDIEVKNQMLSRYGQIEDIEGSPAHIVMADSIPYLKLETLHLKPTSKTRVMDNGELYRIFFVMRGSHTFNTKEMSILIDGTVSEAQELNIETMTPDQISKMLNAWEQRYGKDE